MSITWEPSNSVYTGTFIEGMCAMVERSKFRSEGLSVGALNTGEASGQEQSLTGAGAPLGPVHSGRATAGDDGWSDYDTARERYRDQVSRRQQPEEAPEAEQPPRIVPIDRRKPSSNIFCSRCYPNPCTCAAAKEER